MPVACVRGLTNAAVHSAMVGEAREDWKILRALSAVLGKPLPSDTLGALRERMAEVAPSFAEVDAVTPAAWGPFGGAGAIDPAPFANPVSNFYMTDPISRASPTMAECTAAFVNPRTQATGTDG